MNLTGLFSRPAPSLNLPSRYNSPSRTAIPFPHSAWNLNTAVGLWFSAVILPAAIVDLAPGTVEESDDVFTLANHGLQTGDPVRLKSLTGGTGLVAATIYYFRRLSTSTGYLCSTKANAYAGVQVAVTLDATNVILTPVNAVTTFDPNEFNISGGTAVAPAEGSIFAESVVGLHYLDVREEVIDPEVATVDHTLEVTHYNGSGFVTPLGLSAHENAGPYCARVLVEAPKALALGFAGLENIRISASDITNIRYRLFGIAIRA